VVWWPDKWPCLIWSRIEIPRGCFCYHTCAWRLKIQGNTGTLGLYQCQTLSLKSFQCTITHMISTGLKQCSIWKSSFWYRNLTLMRLEGRGTHIIRSLCSQRRNKSCIIFHCEPQNRSFLFDAQHDYVMYTNHDSSLMIVLLIHGPNVDWLDMM
jgi:hypothetical protein